MTNITKCLYGHMEKVVDVTSIVLQKLNRDGYICANNENFGDPCHASNKRLIITTSDDKIIIVNEDQTLYVRDANLPTDISCLLYWHIFANSGNNIIEIFEEQVNSIINSSLFKFLQNINCCLTGSDLNNYDYIHKRIEELNKQTNGKFKIRKMIFNDNNYEKFTAYAIKEDILSSNINELSKTFIFYIHTKGSINNTPEVVDWRKCIQYFLIEHGDWCVKLMINEDADSAGPQLIPHEYHVGIGLVLPHYSGNFWCARGFLLYNVFSKHQLGSDGSGRPPLFDRNIHRSDYYAWEFFIFKEPHKGINMFPRPINYHPYNNRLSPENYTYLMNKKLTY